MVIADATAFADFLQGFQPQDTVVEILDGDVSVLDGDTHGWSTPPRDAELMILGQTLEPPAPFWFSSHGKGIKALYTGPTAKTAAIIAGMGLPVSFTVEIARQFRHPRSVSSKHGGVEAGVVQVDLAVATSEVRLPTFGHPTPEQISTLLEERGMQRGSCYDHSHCPIASHEPSDAKTAVSALDTAIYCHRCAAKGLTYPGMRKPGIVPYGLLVNGVESAFVRLSKHLIHWRHADVELAHLHPNLGPKLREDAYRLALETAHGDNDPRLRMGFNRNLQVVWSEGGWIDPVSCQATEIDNDCADFLPCVNYVKREMVSDGNGGQVEEVSAAVDRLRRSNIKHRIPEGFTPFRLFRGIQLGRCDAVIPYETHPRQRFPVALLDQPLPWDDAWGALQVAFPGISEPYFKGLVGGPICIEMGGGQDVSVAATGPSGSGKGETVNVAGSLFGDSVVKIQLDSTPEEFMRQIGSATAQGRRFLMFDEAGKTFQLQRKLGQILQIGARITYRPLYFTGVLTVPLRSMFVYPCTFFPDFLRSSPEFLRRTRSIHLPAKVPEWRFTCGGDANDWRGRNTRNALVCNSLLTHIYRLAAASNFLFKGSPGCFADRIGLGSLADGAEGTDPELLRQLYRYARGQLGERSFITKDASFSRGWLDLSVAKAKELISPFIDADEGDVKAMRRSVQTNLQAASWNEVLGIAAPPISCYIRIRGNRWAMRFYSTEPCMRGEEVLNDQLPPIPGDDAPVFVGADPPTSTTTASDTAATSNAPGASPSDSSATVAPTPASTASSTINPLVDAGFPT